MQLPRQEEAADSFSSISSTSFLVPERYATLLGITTNTANPEHTYTYSKNLRYYLFCEHKAWIIRESYCMPVQLALEIDRYTS
jgi:hypothetical protein